MLFVITTDRTTQQPHLQELIELQRTTLNYINDLKAAFIQSNEGRFLKFEECIHDLGRIIQTNKLAIPVQQFPSNALSQHPPSYAQTSNHEQIEGYQEYFPSAEYYQSIAKTQNQNQKTT